MEEDPMLMRDRRLIAVALAALIAGQALASGPDPVKREGPEITPSPASDAPLDLSSSYDCSGQTAKIGVLKKKASANPGDKTAMFVDMLFLRANGTDYPVKEKANAGGKTFIWTGEGPETSLSIAADGGVLTLEGVTYSNCRRGGG